MDAVHRAKLLLLLADFAGVQSAVPAIVARYKVFMHSLLQPPSILGEVVVILC